jgi:small subunit ribosomal protein S13
MARIAGVTLLSKKRAEIALTYIFGIGRSTAQKIILEAGIPGQLRVQDLNDEQTNRLREIVEKKYRVEGELKRDVLSNIKRLKEVGSYRGTRHIKNLPARGQRTKTNSRTVRGNVRRTMGSGKRKLEKT